MKRMDRKSFLKLGLVAAAGAGGVAAVSAASPAVAAPVAAPAAGERKRNRRNGDKKSHEEKIATVKARLEKQNKRLRRLQDRQDKGKLKVSNKGRAADQLKSAVDEAKRVSENANELAGDLR